MSRLVSSSDQSIRASASAAVLPINIQLISFRIEWFDFLEVQGTLKSFLTPQFKSINSLVLSLLYGPTLTSIRDYWKKIIALTCLPGEALQISEKRSEAKGKGGKERYTHLNAEFQRIARSDKKAFLSDQCKEIEEKNRMGKTRDLFKISETPREHFMQRWA